MIRLLILLALALVALLFLAHRPELWVEEFREGKFQPRDELIQLNER